MAIKATVAITGFEPQSDNTYRINLRVWSGAQTALVLCETYFPISAISLTVNNGIKTFVTDYILDAWGIIVTPIVDSIQIVNPISLL